MTRTIISGRIRTFDEENRLISVYCRRSIRFFYLQRSLLNQVSKYLEFNRFIQFTVTDEDRIMLGYKVQTVDYIIKIMEIRYRKNIVYYDIKDIKDGTRKLINSLEYKMFLDLEMSMHPYKANPNFTQEIIQVGYILVDKHDQVISTYNQIIQPTVHPILSRRTMKFLEIGQEDVDNGITFPQFYYNLKEVLDTYQPAVIVWGRNDFLALQQAYKINRVSSLHKATRYVNLLKLHKNYFNLKNDLGLFNALKLYYDTDLEQSHNAFEDAVVTQRIFNGFKRVVNHKQTIDLLSYK